MPLERTPVDEESLSSHLGAPARRAGGVYYTPAPLVELVLASLAGLLPPRGKVALVDPSCGAGAFLAGAARLLPRAKLFGLELSAEAAKACRARVPGATVLEGDALRGGLSPLLKRLPEGAFEVWVGNPPYNGTSSLLRDPLHYARLRALLPSLPRGTSLRDDYAFFLLLAAERLSRRAGALAFVTSATLLDAFLYAPLRRALLDRLSLEEVVELGSGAFAGTRVRTCVSVWRSPAGGAGWPRYRGRAGRGPFEASQLSPPSLFIPRPPEWYLRPPSDEAEALDAAWRKAGEPLSTLVPVSLPGLKTRFDELLVDDDPERLLERVRAFLGAPADRLEGFALAHGIPSRHLAKLAALKASVEEGVQADPGLVRPFFRYAGARHRMSIPADARAFCYLDRRLIPRGDHRFRGTYDPHACPVKLVFNTRELPLAAALVEEPGCVHAHRHARFAPLLVPEQVLRHGLTAARQGAALGPEVPNLSARGLAYANTLGGPAEAFRAIARFVNSPPVQQAWSPAFATSRELWVPL
ncbi:MAG: N-6 DNA methylase [Myxococcaceae bacterium]